MIDLAAQRYNQESKLFKKVVNLPMQYIFPNSEAIQARPWKKPFLPRKLLIIRLHTYGDVLVAMPAVQNLKTLHPSIEMHLLVCKQYADLPRNMVVFSKIHTLKNARGGRKMGFDVVKIYPTLLLERFDAVIDLQNNIFSTITRKALFPMAWCQFDRFSKIHVAYRYQNTINAIGLGDTEIGDKIVLHNDASGTEKLIAAGWNGSDRLIVLNACGLYATRRWGADKYLEFAQMWLEKVDKATKFLLLGLPGMQYTVDLMEKNLGNSCFNLIGQTSLREVFNIVQRVNLTLSDDGGLLHTSWINQVPTIGFLGASPSYWGIPLGKKSFGFTSADLPCGDCHRTECIWGDNRCLARITSAMAFEKAKELLDL